MKQSHADISYQDVQRSIDAQLADIQESNRKDAEAEAQLAEQGRQRPPSLVARLKSLLGKRKKGNVNH